MTKFDEQILIYQCDPKALMRPQEFYENPLFKGKVVLHAVIEEWNQKLHGESYATTWDGFNFPVLTLQAFFSQAAAQLTPEELELKRAIEARPKIKYVIAGATEGVLEHEKVHALYYVCEEYRRQVDTLLKCIPLCKFTRLKNALNAFGYGGSVVVDEMNAYLSTDGLPEIGISQGDFILESKLFQALYQFYLSSFA